MQVMKCANYERPAFMLATRKFVGLQHCSNPVLLLYLTDNKFYTSSGIASGYSNFFSCLIGIWEQRWF